MLVCWEGVHSCGPKDGVGVWGGRVYYVGQISLRVTGLAQMNKKTIENQRSTVVGPRPACPFFLSVNRLFAVTIKVQCLKH